MLTSVLPGLRQVRAPLSAGVIWLLGLWLLVEPRISETGEVRELMDALRDALGDASIVGVGAAWTFAAYLLGTLAIGALTPLLRPLLSSSWLGGERRSGGTLMRFCQRTRMRLETTLALTGVDLDRFLDDQLGVEAEDRRRHATNAPGRWAAHSRSALTHRSPGVSEPHDLWGERASAAVRRERRIGQAVLAELEDVAVSRLLGKEPELYGEWDRDRAEVEFRLALVPALLFLAVAVASRGSWWWVAVPICLVACWGLLRDAARSDFAAQDVVVVALANDRVQSPLIARLLSAAGEEAQYGTKKNLDAAAAKASSALTDALQLLDRAGVSEPAAAHQAAELVDRAASAYGEGKPLFDAAAVERYESALAALRPVAQAWVDIIDGKGAPSFDMPASVQAAHAHHAGFLQAIRGQLARLSTPATEVDE